MTLEQSLKLTHELRELLGESPCLNKYALSRFQEIGDVFRADPDSDNNIKEKAKEVSIWANYWFSQTKWQQFSLSPEQFKVAWMLTSIQKLESALKSALV